MTHPTDSRRANKPEKPSPDFPLTPRADGRWMKRIYGKLYYFTGTADEARAKYEAKVLEIVPPEPAGETQIRHLLEAFTVAIEADVLIGQLSRNTFNGYRRMCDIVYTHFGRLRPVASLTRQDADALRLRLCKGVGAKTQQDHITRTRVVFKWAYDRELMTQPFHLWIKQVSMKTLKRYQAQRPSRLMTADEIRQLIDAAAVRMRAMILLGIGCGFGGTDCSDLTTDWLDLDGGWHTFARPKTGEPRRAKLWPETVAALQVAISQRPRPRNTAHADRVFITRKGTLYVSEDRTRDSLGREFTTLARRVGVARPGVSFYSLRHCFETVSGDACDQVATNLVMGHADGTMAANYRHGIGDDRLIVVADHVHRWLFGTPMGDGRKGLRVVG